tara:strand:- start:301 stop:486 length:186 start_codon:yes stop_codon:yes gene_type:complete
MGIIFDLLFTLGLIMYVWLCLYVDKLILDLAKQQREEEQGLAYGGEGDSFINSAMFLSHNE